MGLHFVFVACCKSDCTEFRLPLGPVCGYRVHHDKRDRERRRVHEGSSNWR